MKKTRNRRLDEGLAGGTEGLFSADHRTTSTLNQYQLHTELDMPLSLLGFSQMLTVGGEWMRSSLNDGSSMAQTTTEAGNVPGLSTQRSTRSRDHMLSFFIEDNIELNDKTLLTPGLRYDKHSVTGGNWSPALNLSHNLRLNGRLKQSRPRLQGPQSISDQPLTICCIAAVSVAGVQQGLLLARQ